MNLVLITAGLLLLPAAGLAQTTPPIGTGSPRPFEPQFPPLSDDYSLGAESLPQANVMRGKTFEFQLKDSSVFPGAVHDITVYVPASYKADKPACLYVGLDGLGFHAATVFDNLIAKGAMPVTVAIGLSPGSVNSAQPPNNPRFDRSFEFDSLSDLLARFLIDEVVPAVEKHATPDGKPIRLSRDPNDRAIGGGSTGAIGAFTVAWERPDSFRRVFSSIGTFVGMRGGEQYYVLVRKTEPKPLRIFMQDGAHDEWGGGPEMGDWWMSNQTMERAFTFAGYDVRHVWGSGTHNGNQASALFPEAMRWLWRDWPTPLRAKEPGNPVLKAILQPGTAWETVVRGCSPQTLLVSDLQGTIRLPDRTLRTAAPLPSTAIPGACPESGNPAAVAYGPDGQLYVASSGAGRQLVSYRDGGRVRVRAKGIDITAMTVRSNRDVYATVKGDNGQGEVWRIRASGDRQRLADHLKAASGIAFSPDGLWLFVAQRDSRFGYSYRVLADGTLDVPAPFYDFSVPNSSDNSGAEALWMDHDGRAYGATRMGVQVFDRNGRVAAILPLPSNLPASSLCFGGKDFDTLYVISGGIVYRRKMLTKGAPPWSPPMILPPWGAG